MLGVRVCAFGDGKSKTSGSQSVQTVARNDRQKLKTLTMIADGKVSFKGSLGRADRKFNLIRLRTFTVKAFSKVNGGGRILFKISK